MIRNNWPELCAQRWIHDVMPSKGMLPLLEGAGSQQRKQAVTRNSGKFPLGDKG
jgi:hypothetical protein